MDKTRLVLQIIKEWGWDTDHLASQNDLAQINMFADQIINFANEAQCDVTSYRLLMFKKAQFAYHCLMITDPHFNHELSLEYQITGPDRLEDCYYRYLYDNDQGPHPQFVMEDGYYLVLFIYSR